MNNTIKIGDTTTLIQELGENSIDALITRLPHPQKSDNTPLPEIDYAPWLRGILYHAWRTLKENANVLLQIPVTEKTLSHIRHELLAAGWFECEKFVWTNNAQCLLQNKGPWRQYEEILWFRKNNSTTQYSIKNGYGPGGLYDSLIGTFTEPGDTILDPFAGLGEVVVSAHIMGRNFIAFEKDADTAMGLKMRLQTIYPPDFGIDKQSE